jgi:carboxylate-amine ligase
MEFNASEPLTVGAEIECQLLRNDTLDLTDGIMKLMEFYPRSPYVKPDFIQNTVEIASPVCDSIVTLHTDILTLMTNVHTRCGELEMRICGAGTHPFSRKLSLVTPFPRYRNMEKSMGHLAHITLTYGTHVHLGMPSGEAAIDTMRKLRRYLPVLIALSANSPFWRGYETGHVAYRHRILAATRSFGIPPSFESWQEYVQFCETMSRAQVFDTARDVHWDIRPHPDFGTVEVRVMDAQSTVRDAMALAAFVRALAATLWNESDGEDRVPRPLPWWIEKENHFQASRLGLQAAYVADDKGTVMPLSGVVYEVLERVQAAAESLEERAYLEHLQWRVNTGLGHLRQQHAFESTGSAEGVAAELVTELDEELLTGAVT